MTALHFFSVLIALSITQAFDKLIPAGKEAIFSWSAEIKAGTHLPVPHASQYILQGKIHLQRYNNSIFIKLTDLTHRLSNGIIDYHHEYETKKSSLAIEVQDLQNIFEIIYTENGLVSGIATQNNEKEFSRNIKKAISSIFQLNSTVLQKEYHRPKSFVVKENSIYGHGNDVYSVFPKNGGKLEVHKLHNMPDSDNIYSYFVTNTEGASCDMRSGKTVMHGSQKNYSLEKEWDFYVVKNINAEGSIVYYPFEARSDAQMISVNQKFDLVEVVPVKEKYQMGDKHFEMSLLYRPFETKQDKLDVKLVSLVRNMLQDIPQYLREDHINAEEPDVKRGQLVNRVQQILLKFNEEKLEELRSTLPEDSLSFFYRILPSVGTEASMLYIKNLIVGNTLNEELAIDMLQNIAGHIRPSVHLIQELEELIHLPSSFSWNLRKVAILSFGNVIYKSYLHQLESNSDNPQTPYEKYVDEYIDRARNSPSYIVKVTYLLGLRNMKLPLLADRLVPSFNGEWWSDQHIRYMAIWASALPILYNSGPDKIIETFWPIFTNRHEKIAVRAIAYYYIMYSRPSLSLLRSIFTYMLTEPDEELYRIHYTLSQTLMQSTDPCHQNAKLRLAEVMKFSPPPRGGTSGISFFGYQDEEFGFSAGVQKYYLRTEELRIYCYYVTSKLFYNYEEEWVVYWKIFDGRNKDPGLVQSIADIISLSRLESFNFHIEASIARRGQIINTFAFDKSSLHELIDFLKFFITDVSKWSKNFLYISHERYNSYLIPTDIGIPAFWQYLMPEVHYNNLTIIKDIDKDNVKLHVENKYGALIHYRHGLSFYNPIADVWQGINKYHSYDALLPLHFNLSLDFKLQKLELHWQKHHDHQMNIAGFRTHARQVVFARDADDYEKEVVPQGDEFKIVGHKEYRHDYPLLDKDSLDAGHRVYLLNYDSDLHEPYGIFKNRLFTFAQPSTKYFHSPLQHWAMAWLHFHRDMVLLPRAGTYGFVARLEPSRKYNVSKIDFTLHQRFDLIGNSSHVPGFDSYSHVIYSVKNHDEILKSWDLSTLVQVASGHNYGSLKLKLNRILPEQKDYKVCVDGYKKWTPNEVDGLWRVSMGESSNVECVNYTVIDISSKGRRSHEQTNGKYKHSSCLRVVPYSAEYYRNMKCLLSHSGLRHYTYKVQGINVPQPLKQTVVNLADDLKGYFHSYYSYDIKHNENISRNSFKVDVMFPLEAHKVNIEVSTAEQTYEFTGLPLKYWDWFKFSPESTTYSLAFVEMYENGEIDHCIVHSNHRRLNKKFISEVVPDEWTLYISNNVDSHDEVYIKQLDNKIAIKIVRDEHALEVVPEAGSDKYHATLDGMTLSSEEQLEDWLHYRVFGEEIDKPVLIFVQQSGIHLEYNVHRVVITVPEGTHWNGHCYAGVKSLISPVSRNLFYIDKMLPSTERVGLSTEKLSPLINKIHKGRYV